MVQRDPLWSRQSNRRQMLQTRLPTLSDTIRRGTVDTPSTDLAITSGPNPQNENNHGSIRGRPIRSVETKDVRVSSRGQPRNSTSLAKIRSLFPQSRVRSPDACTRDTFRVASAKSRCTDGESRGRTPAFATDGLAPCFLGRCNILDCRSKIHP